MRRHRFKRFPCVVVSKYKRGGLMDLTFLNCVTIVQPNGEKTTHKNPTRAATVHGVPTVERIYDVKKRERAERDERMLNLFETGASVEDLAERFRLKASTIRCALSIARRERKNKLVTD
jgi:hypothetical protein